MNHNIKKIICMIMVAMLTIFIMPSICLAESVNRSMLYHNGIFTQELYDDTDSIQFNLSGNIMIDQKKDIEKIYALLAKMKLEVCEKTDQKAELNLINKTLFRKRNKGNIYVFFDASGTGRGSLPSNVYCTVKQGIRCTTYKIRKYNPVEKIFKTYEGFEKKSKENYDMCSLLQGMTQDQVHQVLGEPTGVLSGFWGDVFAIKNGSKIIVYYENTGETAYVKIIDRDGNETLQMNLSV